jgi:hypothetical protein
MPDFGDDEWAAMVCDEMANALDDGYVLAPGTRHLLRARVRVEQAQPARRASPDPPPIGPRSCSWFRSAPRRDPDGDQSAFAALPATSVRMFWVRAWATNARSTSASSYSST